MEKSEAVLHETHPDPLSEKATVQTKVVSGNEAYQEALLKEPPRAFSPISLVLYASCFIGLFCSTMNGYDGTLFNSLMQNKNFLATYGGENQGAWAGIVSNMYTIGGVVALPCIGPAIDTWGRRAGMCIGSIAVIVGAVIMGTSEKSASLGQFMGGRFFVGFGVAIASSAGPIYVIEVSHPAYRGIVTAFYNTWWFSGSIVASAATRGTWNLVGHNSWLVTIYLQAMFPALILVFAWMLPESPRWLYVRGKQEKAKAMLAKFHGEGNIDSIWVQLQLHEYEENLEMNGADKRWWDYRALFKSRKTVYRLFCNCAIQAMGQLAGNSVLTYFQAAAFATAGFTDQLQQNNLSLGNACQQFFFACVGASLVDKVGRRPLLLFSNISCSVVWLCICVSAAIFHNSNNMNKSAGIATLAFQFLFNTLYSIGFTPLQALYPVEVLSFEMRAKGMAFGSLFMNIVSLFNNYVWPIALKAINWKTYIVFCIWCAIQAAIIYFFIPETKNRTLEELDEIFNSPTPVQTSLVKKKLGVTSHGDVVMVENL